MAQEKWLYKRHFNFLLHDLLKCDKNKSLKNQNRKKADTNTGLVSVGVH